MMWQPPTISGGSHFKFYLPLILVLILGFWFYKVRMPFYFHEAIYNKRPEDSGKVITRSQRQSWFAIIYLLWKLNLIINTYVVPVLYMIMPGGGSFERFSPDYSGLMLQSNCLWFLFSNQQVFLGWQLPQREQTLTLSVACQSIRVTIFVKSFGFSMACKSVYPLIRRTGLIFLAHLHPIW